MSTAQTGNSGQEAFFVVDSPPVAFGVIAPQAAGFALVPGIIGTEVGDILFQEPISGPFLPAGIIIGNQTGVFFPNTAIVSLINITGAPIAVPPGIVFAILVIKRANLRRG